MRTLIGPWPDTEEPVREVPLTFAAGRTSFTGPIVHKIKSRSRGTFHDVLEYPDGTWSCPCEDFNYRGSRQEGYVCKHIEQAMGARS